MIQRIEFYVYVLNFIQYYTCLLEGVLLDYYEK